MSEAFDVLPGVVLPVGEVTSRLASMWDTDEPESPLMVHASQMNVVLHFGLDMNPESAGKWFQALVRFAQRYPCRIIVLCPTESDLGNAMQSKLFSQCYIGESHREMCCCEALILRYNSLNSGYLFNQVSIWLESDLPTYYWFSQLSSQPADRSLDAIQKLGVRRCVFDHSDTLTGGDLNEWADKFQLCDLADAALLPIKQNIGQFLSRYPSERICRGLQAVRVFELEASGEGRSLLKWTRSCLDACKDDLSFNPEFLPASIESDSAYSLRMEFAYDNGNYFKFGRFRDGLRSELKANFGGNDESVCVPIKTLTMEQTLAEAFFRR